MAQLISLLKGASVDTTPIVISDLTETHPDDNKPNCMVAHCTDGKKYLIYRANTEDNGYIVDEKDGTLTHPDLKRHTSKIGDNWLMFKLPELAPRKPSISLLD